MDGEGTHTEMDSMPVMAELEAAGVGGLAWEHPGYLVAYAEPGGTIERGSGCRYVIVHGNGYIGVYEPGDTDLDAAVLTLDDMETDTPETVAARIRELIRKYPAGGPAIGG